MAPHHFKVLLFITAIAALACSGCIFFLAPCRGCHHHAWSGSSSTSYSYTVTSKHR
jgi:hypothetical protein